MPKRIAVISDIHGNIPALEAVVNDIQKRKVDHVLNLGDHLSGPLYPYETIQYLMQQDWINIAGNHERQLLTQDPQQLGLSDAYARRFLGKRELDWLRSLPASMPFAGEFFLFHGTPSSDKTYLLETIEHGRNRLATQSEIEQRLGELKAPVLLCGHSHTPRLVQMPGGILLINPGSVGLQAYEDDAPESHIIENGSPHARYALLEQQNLQWYVEMIAIPYDFQLAARQAHNNHRSDWEAALLTGYMSNR